MAMLKMPFGRPPEGLQQRLPDWTKRLSELVNRKRNEPYRYGISDCWCFAAAAVHAVTGVTLLPEVVPPRSWMAAAKFLIKHDLEDVEELAIAALGILPGDPDHSKPGDLVVNMLGEEKHLAVRVDNSAITPVAGGLITVERPTWVAGFAIGWDPTHVHEQTPYRCTGSRYAVGNVAEKS